MPSLLNRARADACAFVLPLIASRILKNVSIRNPLGNAVFAGASASGASFFIPATFILLVVVSMAALYQARHTKSNSDAFHGKLGALRADACRLRACTPAWSLY